MKRQLSFVALSALLFAACGCGKDNIFSFAHSAGSNSSSTALSSDASQALQNKDYAKALQYYAQILQSNPADSQAIYGYCAAELANSGIDIASLVSNLVQQNSSSNSSALSRLAPAIAYAAHSGASLPNSPLLPASITGANRQAIENAVNDVLGSKRLLKIIQGKGDGNIAPDNVDVNVNIAFCLILKAGLRVYDSNLITFDDNYNVTVTAASVSDPQVIAVANDAGQDVASAYQRLLAVAKKLHLGSDSMISQINSDVNNLFGSLENQIPGITVKIGTDYYYLYGTY